MFWFWVLLKKLRKLFEFEKSLLWGNWKDTWNRKTKGKYGRQKNF